MERRDFLKHVGLVAAGTTLATSMTSCASLARMVAAREKDGPYPEEHARDFALLSRLSFGPSLRDRARLNEMGLTAYLEEQLAYKSIDDFLPHLRWRYYEALSLEAHALATWKKTKVVRQLKEATLLKRIYSNRQLYERMVAFWSDHFNISIKKGSCWYLKVVDDREVIRKHALGYFRDLLQASVRSPAMLVYLDNTANHKDAPNENYARELLELHSLGIQGGYSQRDVMELARVLTGWTVKEHFWLGELSFDKTKHDPAKKTILASVFEPGAGALEALVDKLAYHPATARHISTKLLRYFVSDDPQKELPDLLEKLTRTFIKTKGNIRAVLRSLFQDGLFSMETLPKKFKRPTYFVVSCLRLLGADTNAKGLDAWLGKMGQALFEWPSPEGAPHVTSAWSRHLSPRWAFVLALAQNELPGTRLNPQTFFGDLPLETRIDRLSTLLFGSPLAKERKKAMLASLDKDSPLSILLAGLLASPRFQWA